MAYFPFFIEIEEKNWLLAGAGSVALRKARALLSYQARVTVVAPKIDEGFFLLRQENEENLLLLPRGFQDSDLEKMDFVIAKGEMIIFSNFTPARSTVLRRLCRIVRGPV